MMTPPTMKYLLTADGGAQNHDFIPYVGCGMGFERPVQFITGARAAWNAPHIRASVSTPRLAGCAAAALMTEGRLEEEKATHERGR